MDAAVQSGDVLLGKYRVERVLGQGGMGMVLAARHLELGELFAIKLLLPEALENEDARNRFVREARAAARLKGEHVARVHDVGRLENGAPYMVMEYLEGSDLKALLRAQGPLPPEQAVGYALQVCHALEEAHALGIIHRDLKPANLFLARRSSGGDRVKILDFGISKELSPAAGDLTRTGELLGTPFYMSPEQMVRTKEVDARSDVWAMGVVLYELSTGVLPFQAQTLTEVVGKVLQEEPPPPSQVRPGLPAALDAVVQRCLQKRAEHRFPSVRELADALRGVLGAGAGMAAPMTVAAVALTPGVAVVAPGAGQVATGTAWGTTHAAKQVGRRNRRRVAAVFGSLLGLGLSGGGMWLAQRGGAGEGAPASGAAASAAPSEAASDTAAPEGSARAAEVIVSPAATVEPSVPDARAEVPQTATAAGKRASAAPAATTTSAPGKAAAAPGGTEKKPAPAPAPVATPALAPKATPTATATATPTLTPKKHEGLF